jgi:hypothetical protein
MAKLIGALFVATAVLVGCGDDDATDASTVVEGLEELVDALAEFDGVEGEAALEAVQGATDVDLEELAESIDAVDEYASQNCDGVGDE